MKKLKFKNKLFIGTLITILILILTPIFIFHTFIGYADVDENGKILFYDAFRDWITGKNKIVDSKVTNVLVKADYSGDIPYNIETLEKYLQIPDRKIPHSITILFTFNYQNICIGARYCISGLTEEELEERTSITDFECPSYVTNVKVENNKLIYTLNSWNNKSKDEIISTLKNTIHILYMKLSYQYLHKKPLNISK